MPTEQEIRMQLVKAEWYRTIAKQLSDKLKCQPNQLEARITELLDKAKQLETTLAKYDEKCV